MGKLTAATISTAGRTAAGETAGDGLSLRTRANGTRTWEIEYLFKGKRRRLTIGIRDRQGAAGESISSWPDDGRLTLAEARAIAGQWNADRHGGRDPIAEREARLEALRAAAEAQRDPAARAAARPT